MPFAGAASDPYGDITLSDIDTWWASQAPTDSSTWSNMFTYIMKDVISGIPSGHTVEHGPNDGETSYYLTISGSTINKTWGG